MKTHHDLSHEAPIGLTIQTTAHVLFVRFLPSLSIAVSISKCIALICSHLFHTSFSQPKKNSNSSPATVGGHCSLLQVRVDFLPSVCITTPQFKARNVMATASVAFTQFGVAATAFYLSARQSGRLFYSSDFLQMLTVSYCSLFSQSDPSLSLAVHACNY